PAVAELCQRTRAALEVGGGDVVENERPSFEVLGRKGVLDPYLLPGKPVHGEVEIVLQHATQAQNLSKTAGCRFRIESPGGGELRLRLDDSSDDHGQYQRELSALFRGDDPVEAGFDESAQHRGHMPVGEAAQD